MSDPQEPIDAPPPVAPGPGLYKRILRYGWVTLRAAAMFGMAAWATLAVYYSDLSGSSPRAILALLLIALFIGSLFLRKPRYLGGVAFVALFLIVFAWFFSIRPSNDRQWLVDVAVLPYAEIDGDRLTVHNIRNFDYTSEEQFTPRYYNKTFDLGKLKRVDYILSYWSGRAIAHSMASFEFDGDEYLAISIETRKESGEAYSAVQGFFRQYELTYVIADERDVLKLRTNFRKEDVYVFRTLVPPQNVRTLLLSYLKSANELKEKPEFYNALTTNCATSILPHIREYNPAARISMSIILNGHSARAAHARGGLDQRLSFDELERRSHVNAAAIAAGDSSDFSKLIRQGIPDPLK
jgi:Domain of unknown function (DUF4105)